MRAAPEFHDRRRQHGGIHAGAQGVCIGGVGRLVRRMGLGIRHMRHPFGVKPCRTKRRWWLRLLHKKAKKAQLHRSGAKPRRASPVACRIIARPCAAPLESPFMPHHDAPRRPAPADQQRLAIDTIHTLAMDAVQKANSGHPARRWRCTGRPCPVARCLRTDPACPDWPNRDRFVLSVGHASMLLYAVLHLAGVEEIDADGRKTGQPAVSLADIEQFRQLAARLRHPNIA
jgi:hypothetical protein